MTAQLNPYPAYVDTGLSWLERIPEHWTIERAKWFFRKMDRPADQRDEVVTCFRDGQVTLRRKRRIGGFTESLQEIGYQGVRRGDLVIHAMDAFAGAVGVSDSDGKGTPVYCVCEPRSGVSAYYYAYVVREMARSQWILALAKGIRERSTDFRYEAFASQRLPVPLFQEQESMVRFLDHMDRRVRRLVRDKQKLIGLLEEQKEVIIQRAVTRGLHSDVCMKPARAEWLGNIPEHWTVLPVRYLFRAVTRRDVRGDETKLSVTQKRGLIPTGDMEEKSTQAASFDRFQVCHPGDLVLNKYKAHLGVFWSAEQRGLVTPNYTVFRPAQPLSTKFFEILFHTPMYRSVFSMTVYGVTEGMSPLYTQDFYRILVVHPPVNEQEAIVRYVADETATHCAAIARAESEISLLREFRASLVADVVTGRLDVREASASLPSYDQDLQEEEVLAGDEEADESAQLDAALEEVDA